MKPSLIIVTFIVVFMTISCVAADDEQETWIEKRGDCLPHLKRCKENNDCCSKKCKRRGANPEKRCR
uniref:Opicalcin-2 n=1 Tax=Opistophthalmus carinatus TaxID=190115 RepID=CAOP2_OPICA|nr:RecName: Full=Opicalcin-2; Short=OpCa2; AltName: Full=Opicalcine-2; Flags: Precursor [Opistophthalmus carinatus]